MKGNSNRSFSYTCCVFLVKNLILHANSYKDPSRYKVQMHGFLSAEKRFEITLLIFKQQKLFMVLLCCVVWFYSLQNPLLF